RIITPPLRLRSTIGELQVPLLTWPSQKLTTLLPQATGQIKSGPRSGLLCITVALMPGWSGGDWMLLLWPLLREKGGRSLCRAVGATLLTSSESAETIGTLRRPQLEAMSRQPNFGGT